MRKISVYQLLNQIDTLLDSEAKKEIVKIIELTYPDIIIQHYEYPFFYAYVYSVTHYGSFSLENSFQLADVLSFLKAPKSEPYNKQFYFNSDIYFNFKETFEKIQNDKIKIWILKNFNQGLDVRILKHFDIESLFIPMELEKKPRLIPIKPNFYYHGYMYNLEYVFIGIGAILFLTTLLS